METPDPSNDLAAWMKVVKRAAQVLGEIDLGKVADHDAQEVAKLDEVVDEFNVLAHGALVDDDPPAATDDVPILDEVEVGSDTHEPDGGVPVDKPVRTVAANELGKSEVLERIKTLGEQRLDRIYLESSKSPESLDMVPHRKGLPGFDICVCPDHAPINGACGIFITTHGASACVIADPFAEQRWVVIKSVRWESLDEMVEIVSGLIEQPTC